MLKQKAFNYITLIFAVITIFMAIFASHNNNFIWSCVLMLGITLFFSYISRKYNDEMLYMNKKDKEALEKMEYVMKNGRVKKIPKSNVKEGNKK